MICRATLPSKGDLAASARSTTGAFAARYRRVMRHRGHKRWAPWLTPCSSPRTTSCSVIRPTRILALTPAGTLSYGQRELLVFAAALMPDPELILLDEPTAAVNPTMISQMKEHILALHRQGKTVLLVEHNMDVVMDISQRVVVLDHGQKIAEGPPQAIQRDPRVIEAYFGR